VTATYVGVSPSGSVKAYVFLVPLFSVIPSFRGKKITVVNAVVTC